MFEAAIQFPNISPNVPFLAVPAFNLGDLTIGPLHLRWYALAYIVGLVLGWRLIVSLLREPRHWAPGPAPMTVAQSDDFLFWTAIGVILGGRLGYVLFYMLPEPSLRAALAEDPLMVLRTWEGGMSFHGGLIGVTLSTLWFCRSADAPILRVFDLAAVATPIGLFFGRIANFINGELWGRQTDAPWGVIFCNDTIRAANGGACPAGEAPRHPSQLYEAALEGIVLFLILAVVTYRFGALRRPGLNAGIFLMGYGLARGFVELVREPDAHMPEALRGTVTMGMLLCVPMVLLGAYLIRRAFVAPAPAAA